MTRKKCPVPNCTVNITRRPRHVERHLEQVNQDSLKCNICQQVFTTKFNKFRHCQTVHRANAIARKHRRPEPIPTTNQQAIPICAPTSVPSDDDPAPKTGSAEPSSSHAPKSDVPSQEVRKLTKVDTQSPVTKVQHNKEQSASVHLDPAPVVDEDDDVEPTARSRAHHIEAAATSADHKRKLKKRYQDLKKEYENLRIEKVANDKILNEKIELMRTEMTIMRSLIASKLLPESVTLDDESRGIIKNPVSDSEAAAPKEKLHNRVLLLNKCHELFRINKDEQEMKRKTKGRNDGGEPEEDADDSRTFQDIENSIGAKDDTVSEQHPKVANEELNRTQHLWISS